MNIVKDYVAQTQVGPNDLPITNYCPVESVLQCEKFFAHQPEMIAYYNEQFGKYPFSTYGGIVLRTEFGGALETQTLTTYGNSVLSIPKVEAENIVAHELAHSWFGNSISLKQWKDIWLNEGFVTYASATWMEHAHGKSLSNAAENWKKLSMGDLSSLIPTASASTLTTNTPSSDPGNLPATFSINDARGILDFFNAMPPQITGMFQANFLQAMNKIQIMDMKAVRLTRDQVKHFLLAFPPGTLVATQVSEVITQVPEIGISWQDFMTILKPYALEQTELTLENFKDMLSALPLENISINPEDFPSIVSGLIPGLVVVTGGNNQQVTEGQIQITPPGRPGSENLFNPGVYQRGALTLYALRQKIGVEALMKLFQSYFAMFKDNNAATQDFIDLAEKISGQELSDFFNAWLYEDVVPEIK